MKSSIHSLLFPGSALLLTTFTLSALNAQIPVPVDGTYTFYSDITYDGSLGSIRQQVSSETIWLIEDGATVTVANSEITGLPNGGPFGQDIVQTIRIEPLGTTGRIEFINNTTEREGGVFFMGMAGARLYLTNAAFIGNQGTRANPGNAAGEGGGAIRAASASEMHFTNVLFEKNRARQGGAIYAAGNVFIQSSTFVGNYAHSWNYASGEGVLMGNVNSGYGGAINFSMSSMKYMVAHEASFINNWARRGGGAINARTRYSVELWDTVDISNNFAAFGGAIGDNNTVMEDGEGVFFKYTGTTGKTEFVYSGNMAGGADFNAAQVTAAEATGMMPVTPQAKAGGFYHSGTFNNAAANTRLFFDIATGVTVQIGQPGNPSAWDSIATMDATGPTARFDLVGSGAGRLILHADNSYFQGTVNVRTGSLLLGNPNASLGGVINVAPGATFGGAGTLITHKQDDSVSAGRTSLILDGGAILKLGNDTASSAETLRVMGGITAAEGVVFTHDLFEGGSASKLLAENINLAGPATINLNLLATGTFTIMEWTGAMSWSGTNLTNENLNNAFTLTVDGVTDNPRATASLALSGNTIAVTSTVSNLIMRWTGAEGGKWMLRPTTAQRNWAEAGGASENRYFSGDTVVFDGIADAANPASRDITIEAGVMLVSGMEVTGTERYVFRGEGGIEANAAEVGNVTFTPSGKLTKSGEGELVFANTGGNNFQGGIDIAGGVITFDNAAQLGAGTGGITFSDSGTLHAVATVHDTLSENLSIAAGKTAVIQIDSGELAYGGLLTAGGAGATLRKTGEGAMLLTGDSAANTGALVVEAGKLTLAAPSAAIGGNITVNSGAMLNGVGSAGNGGGVTIASGGIIDIGQDNAQPGALTLHNLTATGGATFKLDLFTADDGSYKASDRILGTGASAISGNNTIDLTSFATGTFNLGNITALAAGTKLTLSNMELPASGRISATLSGAGPALELTVVADQSRAMTWTGGSGTTWNLANANWTDGTAINQYSYGDRVLFDGSASAANRNINIGGDEVHVADITVSGNADHTFTGGGIHAGAGNVQHDGIADATGKLVKTGEGTLTFANEKNTFLGGVDLDAGTLVIGSGDHITTDAATGITFTNNATLRAANDLAINDDVLVAAGKTATLDSAGNEMTLAGTFGGASDTTLAKIGSGAVAIASDMAGFSGTVSVREGTLRAGAANVFTTAPGATFVVNDGATLDLAGHNQTLVNLQGPGAIELGSATLTLDIGPVGAEFNGSFSGAGTVAKAGAGKWTPTGSSSHTGGIILRDGEIGLVNSAALGSGPITLDSQPGRVSIDAAGLSIPNNITAGTSVLTIANNGHSTELSGRIGGRDIVLDGSGTVTLSGANSYTRLTINTPHAIMKRADSASGLTIVADGSTLEFRGVGSGRVMGVLSGDRVLFTSSTLSLNTANTLKTLEIGAGSHITAMVNTSIGGADASVIVRGTLRTADQGTLARNMIVDGGALEFGSTGFGSGWRIASIALSGTMNFANGGEVRLAGRLHTGIHNAAVAYGGITGFPEYNANQDGMFMNLDIIDGNLLRITAYDMAIEPGKDIAAGYDAMRASLDAVYSHLSDNFLAPLSEPEAPSNNKAFWARVIGSFAEHESDHEFLGYSDNTFAVVLGYDWISDKNFMFGGFVGFNKTRLETHNNATTDINLPIFGLYAAKRWGNYYASTDVAWSRGDADTLRYETLGARIDGSYDLNTIAGGVKVGRVFGFPNGQIRPSVGIHYTTLSFSNYAETGHGAVRFDNIRTDSLQASINLDGSRHIKLFRGIPGMIDLGLGLRQDLSNKRTNISATLIEYPDNGPLPIRGDKFDNTTVAARLGLRAMLTKTTLVALSYEYNYIPFGNHRNATRRDTFSATVRQSW